MEDLKVITFVGMPGAGKSSCVEYLEQKGLPSAYFGGITIDELKARGMEVNEVNERIVREDIRKKEGLGAYAQRIVTKVDGFADQGQRQIVVDGLYSWTEYKIFKEKYGDKAFIIAITAPRKLRHQRLSSRPVRPLTDKEVTAREYAEIENLEKGGPIANADYTIVNDNSLDVMLRGLDRILNEIGVSV
jgi:dephospho-CoA kinase